MSDLEPGPSKTEILSDGKTVSSADPLPVLATFSGTVGKVDQGTGSGDAAKYWVQRLTDGTGFLLPAKDSTLTDGSAKVVALLNDGTQQVGTAAKPVQVQIGDGTNQAAVKAASTPAATADKAAVVALSSNAPALTSAITSKATSNSSVTLLAANSARKSASFYNAETAADLYLNEAGDVATTSIGGFTVCLKRDSGNGGGYYELPTGANGGVAQNTITGIWSTTGSLGVTVTERT